MPSTGCSWPSGEIGRPAGLTGNHGPVSSDTSRFPVDRWPRFPVCALSERIYAECAIHSARSVAWASRLPLCRTDRRGRRDGPAVHSFLWTANSGRSGRSRNFPVSRRSSIRIRQPRKRCDRSSNFRPNVSKSANHRVAAKAQVKQDAMQFVIASTGGPEKWETVLNSKFT